MGQNASLEGARGRTLGRSRELRTTCVLTDVVYAVSVGCHWVGLIMPGEAKAWDIAREFERVVSELIGRKNAILITEGAGSRWYRRSMYGKGIWLEWEHKTTGSKAINVQFKGEALEVYGQDVIREMCARMMELGAVVSRIDVAFDGVKLEPEDWYKAWKKGKVKGRQVDYLENNRGKAARVGVLRREASQVSMYDERGAVRLEFRTRKRELAKRIMEAWISDGAVGIEQAGLKALRGFVGGTWGPLDDWLGSGKRWVGEVMKKKEKKIDMAAVNRAAKQLVLYGMKEGGLGAVSRALTMAAKWIKGADLDEWGIDYTEVAKVFGRFGPDGYSERTREMEKEISMLFEGIMELENGEKGDGQV